jgi:hypothetical protein
LTKRWTSISRLRLRLNVFADQKTDLFRLDYVTTRLLRQSCVARQQITAATR